jgi:hypothetical protein
MTIIALTADADAQDALQTQFEASLANGLASIGDAVVILDGDNDLFQDVLNSGLATSAVDLNQMAGLDALMDAVAADPTELEGALTALFGAQGRGLTEDVTIPLGGWLLQFSPAYAQEVAEAPLPLPASDAQAGAIVCVDEPTPDPVEPASPLRSPRFAGEPILEQCLAGTHRMLTPESGRAVMKVQAALIDLGFSLPMFGADGAFGGETGDAVTAFKTGQEIFPNDPVVGRQTMARLDAIFAP